MTSHDPTKPDAPVTTTGPFIVLVSPLARHEWTTLAYTYNGAARAPTDTLGSWVDQFLEITIKFGCLGGPRPAPFPNKMVPSLPLS